MDECADDTLNECHENGDCNNTIGSYDCMCTIGYTGDGFNCSGTYVHLYIQPCTYIRSLHTYLGLDTYIVIQQVPAFDKRISHTVTVLATCPLEDAT